MYKQRLHVKKKFKKFLNSIKLFLLFSTEISSTVYRNVHYRVPRCPVPSTEMSHMLSTEMSRSRDVLIPWHCRLDTLFLQVLLHKTIQSTIHNTVASNTIHSIHKTVNTQITTVRTLPLPITITACFQWSLVVLLAVPPWSLVLMIFPCEVLLC